jgi:hypothetical protein
MSADKICWHRPEELIPAMAGKQREWGRLGQTPQGRVLGGLLGMTGQLLGKKPNLIVDVGCGVCPLLDIVDAERYVGVDLPANVGEIRKVVGPGVKLMAADAMSDDLSSLSGAEVVVMSAFLDVMERPLVCLRRVLAAARGHVILHRQLIHDGPTSAKLEYSYLGQDTSFKSVLNRREFYDVVQECGYGVAAEVLSFGTGSGEDSRSFVLVRGGKGPVSYFPRTWGAPENAGDARTESLKRIAPDLFCCESALYVGADRIRFDYGEDFISSKCRLTVLEAWRENIEALTGRPGISSLVHGDVSEMSFPDKSFDAVFWWHGPEHVEAGKLVDTIRRMESAARKMVVLGCPRGAYPQGAYGGNPFEEHKTHLGESFFSEMGYAVECLGDRDQIGSNITAVKRP